MGIGDTSVAGGAVVGNCDQEPRGIGVHSGCVDFDMLRIGYGCARGLGWMK